MREFIKTLWYDFWHTNPLAKRPVPKLPESCIFIDRDGQVWYFDGDGPPRVQ